MKIKSIFILFLLGTSLIACKETESLITTEPTVPTTPTVPTVPTEPEPTVPLPSDITPAIMVEIPDGLNEISGAIYHNQQSLYGHNDSGSGPQIFDISLSDKTVNKTIDITNATNVDWEDLAQDDDFIYAADIGNNRGKRKDLKIYKVAKDDAESSTAVTAESIGFSFSDQTDFTNRIDHNFNCEAVISFNDQLYLFSKNRLDLKTKCYTLTKTAGDHTAELKSEFDVEGLITAATISKDKNVLALLGYTELPNDVFEPFLWIFYDFTGDDFFSGKSRKLDLTIQGQMEALCFGENKDLYFAAETESGLDDQYVYHFDIEAYLNE